MNIKSGIKYGSYGDYEEAVEIKISDNNYILFTDRRVINREVPVNFDSEVTHTDWFDAIMDIIGNRVCGDKELQNRLLGWIDPSTIESHTKRSVKGSVTNKEV